MKIYFILTVIWIIGGCSIDENYDTTFKSDSIMCLNKGGIPIRGGHIGWGRFIMVDCAFRPEKSYDVIVEVEKDG